MAFSEGRDPIPVTPELYFIEALPEKHPFSENPDATLLGHLIGIEFLNFLAHGFRRFP
jgi:hypothetical protein